MPEDVRKGYETQEDMALVALQQIKLKYDRMEEALRFYAGEDNYYRHVTREYHSMYDNIAEPSEAQLDEGARAREALGA